MRQFSCLTLVFILFNSCIPLNIAPNIKDYKIIRGNRIKRSLPKKTVFVFEDTKDADEFYSYVNTKYNLEDYYVDVQVPVVLMYLRNLKKEYLSTHNYNEVVFKN